MYGTSIKSCFQQDLTPDHLKGVLNAIQCEVQYKGDQVAWMDSCCLQLFINRQGYTFQMENPDLRKAWITGKI